MGGMAAQIPVKNDPEANEEAFAKVRADKEREARRRSRWHLGRASRAGASRARSIRPPDAAAEPNRSQTRRRGCSARKTCSISVRAAPITEARLAHEHQRRRAISGSLAARHGAVPLFNLMEDAATAEISRAQVWQWIRHPDGKLSDGRKVTKKLFREMLTEELMKIKQAIGVDRFAKGKFEIARDLFDKMTTDDEFAEFLTLPGYEKLE